MFIFGTKVIALGIWHRAIIESNSWQLYFISHHVISFLDMQKYAVRSRGALVLIPLIARACPQYGIVHPSVRPYAHLFDHTSVTFFSISISHKTTGRKF